MKRRKGGTTVRAGDYEQYETWHCQLYAPAYELRQITLANDETIQIALELSWLRSLFRSLFLHH